MISLSTRNFKHKWQKIAICLISGVLLLTGCEGPSTTVLSRDEAEDTFTASQISSIVPKSSVERLSEAVEILYTGNSETGTPVIGENNASTDPAVYILSSLRSLSYDVAQSGEIIEAVSKAGDDSDICLLFACYGGSEGGTCASDTAAGAAVLLGIAENLSGLSGDTEIRFVFLPGERSETLPIYNYLTEVYSADHERLLGAVVIGGLGLCSAKENELGCVDGKATFMADQINRICAADFGSECVCTSFTEGVQNVLLRNSIPAVVYRQRETADAGTVLDCPSIIDYGYLQESADVLSRMLALLLGDTTPSMRARAHFTDDPNLSDQGILTWKDDLFTQFGKTESDFEAASGLLGEQVSQNIDNTGRDLYGYRFMIRWFDMDEVLPSDFYYLSDSLQGIEIGADAAGVDIEDASLNIASCYGECTQISDSPYGDVFEWVLPMQRVSITLAPRKEGYDLRILEYDTPPAFYPAGTLGSERLEKLFEQVIPGIDRENINFEAYTDGYGNTIGTIAEMPASSGDKRWIFGLDLDDALSKNAYFKNKMRSVEELLRLYGEYLARDNAALYYDGYHSRFGGSEDDFAQSFTLFSLAGTPASEAGPAADPVRYFYGFDELTEFRDTVREIK